MKKTPKGPQKKKGRAKTISLYTKGLAKIRKWNRGGRDPGQGKAAREYRRKGGVRNILRNKKRTEAFGGGKVAAMASQKGHAGNALGEQASCGRRKKKCELCTPGKPQTRGEKKNHNTRKNTRKTGERKNISWPRGNIRLG